MRKLLLIDGHSILYRAFYGVPAERMVIKGSFHTNAIHGFMLMMLNIIDEEEPTHLAVAFDMHGATFRHKMYDEYKGTRKPMPKELSEQVPVLQDILMKMNIPVITLPGYEGDDILGTEAEKAEDMGYEVSIFSGDRDLLQLATENTTIIIPKTKKSGTVIERYNSSGVFDLYNVTPEEFVDVKAIMGDPSDNIPGVKGIGEKGAINLISKYHSIENLYDHLEDINNTRQRSFLEAGYDSAVMSKKLAVIVRNAPVSFDADSCSIDNIFTFEAYDKLKDLGLRKIMDRFDAKSALVKPDDKPVISVSREQDIDRAFEEAGNCHHAGISIHDNGSIFSVTLALEGCIYFVSSQDSLEKDYIIDKLRILVKSGAHLAVFDVKENNKYLGACRDSNLFDLKLASYLIDPASSRYDYYSVSLNYLDEPSPDIKEFYPPVKKGEIPSEDKIENIKRHQCCVAETAWKAMEILENKLIASGMDHLYSEIEYPLLYVLFDMENTGILIRPDELEAYGERLKGRICDLENEIYADAGHKFNINSPKQLGIVLFDELKLPPGKKTKTGYSTSADVLEKLSEEYPFVKKILDYRQLTKLYSTYARGLLEYVDEDNRIRGHFNQTVTATGRISSTDPNLQNIPVRMPLGREIRKVFVPKEGCVFIDADYSQIELRVLAHMSGDESLIEAYRNSADVHAATASLVFDVPLDDVTPEQRRAAKAVNFGIVYGISDFGLGQDLSISRQKAKEYISNYFNHYPGVKEYLDHAVESARNLGYSVTMYGRKRPVPELQSSNGMTRKFGERIAMNSPIQGTAADIMKIAMINVSERLKSERLKSKIVLQVHDELLIETFMDEIDAVKNILKEEMTHAANLRVPLVIDVNEGINWDEAH